jgi:hypothetical protein
VKYARSASSMVTFVRTTATSESSTRRGSVWMGPWWCRSETRSPKFMVYSQMETSQTLLLVSLVTSGVPQVSSACKFN